jgi:hypothetical protein
VAYVFTNYSAVPLATVEGQINTYLGQYGSLIKGFFVDTMTNDNSPVHLDYYHTLYSFIKGLDPTLEVVGNPGTSTVPDYLLPGTVGADVLVTYENTAAIYAGFPPPSWVFGFSPSHFANLVHTEPTVAGMQADIALGVQRNVGAIYVTDRTLPNPYDQLPSYWDQEVAALKAAAVPEPGGVALAAWGVASALAAVQLRRRK